MEIVEIHFPEIASTNAWAKEHLSSFARDKIHLITAKTQLQGRGRFGRVWHSACGENIYATFAFFIESDKQDPLSLTHVLALSVVHVLKEYGVQARIKWPNDVMVEGKKIAGILCETVPFEDCVGVVLGVGLNVNMQAKELSEVGQPATSLLVECGKEREVKSVIEATKKRFVQDLERYKKEGFTPFAPLFRQLLLQSPNNGHIL
jgi:BirA family biotin operon repressor/biotin-[acetyl-CoA-carboxylase] ligase